MLVWIVAYFSVGHNNRSTYKVKRKWIDMKNKTISKNQAIQHPKTGGGKMPTLKPWEQKIVDQLAVIKSNAVSGIPGGVETMVRLNNWTLLYACDFDLLYSSTI